MRESRRLGGVGTGCIIWLCLGLWRGEQIAGFCDVLGTGTVGEQAVATDAVEAAWQPWTRKRRMNSVVASVMTLFRSRPSTR